jgi:hypothetical protein
VVTSNVGSRAPACPPFIVALRERGPTAIHGRRPRSGCGSDLFPDPEITFLTTLYYDPIFAETFLSVDLESLLYLSQSHQKMNLLILVITHSQDIPYFCQPSLHDKLPYSFPPSPLAHDPPPTVDVGSSCAVISHLAFPTLLHHVPGK